MATFHYLHLRAFAHETEVPDKVRQAVRFAAQAPEHALEESHVEGSHKNRILIIETDQKSAPASKKLFVAIARDDPQGFARLVEEAPKRVDEHMNFFFRLDKQAAYQGRAVLTTADDAIAVRGKIRSFESKRSGSGASSALNDLTAFLEGVVTSPRGTIGQ